MLLGQLFTDSLDDAIIRLSAKVGRKVHEKEVNVNLKFDGNVPETVVTIEHTETKIGVQYKGGVFISSFRAYDNLTLMPGYQPPTQSSGDGAYEV